MNVGIDLIVDNIGVSFEITFLLIMTIGSFIFFARNFSIGAIMLLISNALAFALCYQLDLNYGIPLTFLLISVIILTLSLWAYGKVSTTRGLV